MKLNNILLYATLAVSTAAAPLKETKRSSVFQWLGTNESGAEFGENNLPGQWLMNQGTDYIFPDPSTINTLIDKGMNIFRVQFRMERLAPSGMTGGFDEDYLRNLTTVVEAITEKGVYAIVDPHNYGRFNGAVITSTEDFQTFWKNVAGLFASNDHVIFDTNNEYHDMDQTLVVNLNQAAINGIRAAGATTQYIFVEGNSWSGAWSWTEINDSMKDLTDPHDKIVYEMHQYLDSDGSGTSETCVSETIGAERVSSATQWLKENGKVGILGEFAGGVNEVCRSALQGMLSHLGENTEVWKGAVWWAAGPWWGEYMFNLEPTGGVAYTGMMDVLEEYL
ncbi:hypothetical protein ASPWEDRAFT_68921 [Aspergillus wentii DTO 134E9]|uniref:cellulase n=1 Tax=Aspergillus wentii DTO 134E9 TaxID=1073089 RepID=A0A1L9RL16_ASPWE|nr:uncharacterized protein ASPWEDRAFT_68921 [Aspergillus wentii DTO 134E9]OJJ35604.1 hypothetical protein ASPWEDRAFT_68921 [Aspergillus wentii DTO 134E9]